MWGSLAVVCGEVVSLCGDNRGWMHMIVWSSSTLVTLNAIIVVFACRCVLYILTVALNASIRKSKHV